LTIQDFRQNPLSDRVIDALLAATQAYAQADVLMNEYQEVQPTLSPMLFALDLYYEHYGAQNSIEEILHNLYIPNKKNALSDKIDVFVACMEFAEKKVKITDVLTAGDLLKIDDAIKCSDKSLLSTNAAQTGDKKLIQDIWPMLHSFYSPERQYPLLLEAAIVCYSLLTLPESRSLALRTINILLSCSHQGNSVHNGLLRQWILSTNPRTGMSSLNAEDAIIHITGVFRDMWIYTAKLIRNINQKQAGTFKLIEEHFPHRIPAGIRQYLSEYLCIRNRDVMERSTLSLKTVIKYLRELEERKVVSSVKCGREVYYFSNVLTDLLYQQVGE
jgi:hypothetical protein